MRYWQANFFSAEVPNREQIKQARTDAGLTQTQAAEKIYCSLGAWKKWESGERRMHSAFWGLFLIKIDAQLGTGNNMKIHILQSRAYNPGELPPEGYLAWHEWAEVQLSAGINHSQCGNCGLWRTPQEMSADVIEYIVRAPVCGSCCTANIELNPYLV